MKTVALLACLWLLCAPTAAQDKPAEKPKPEIKQVSALGIARGKTVALILYGENLSPQTAALTTTDGKTTVPATLTLSPVEPTMTDEEKKRGAQRVRLDVALPADIAPDVYTLTLAHAGDVKATAPLAVWETAPVEAEIKRPNDTHAQAMPLEGAFVAVTGSLQNGDRPDVYRWNAKAGETWEVTCLAGRAGSQTDAIVRLRDARHLPLALAAGDERQDRRLTFRAPKTGTYFLEVSDAEGRAGENFRYRVTLRQITPDKAKSSAPEPTSKG